MAEKRDWQTKAERELKGRDATWHVPEGFAIQPLYTAEDAAYWSSTPTGTPGERWGVSFRDGTMVRLVEGQPFYARCVKSG